jgi:hypothetical protein
MNNKLERFYRGEWKMAPQHQHPMPSPSVTNDPMVLITRRRWTRYFLPATLAAAALGVIEAIATGELRFLLVPFPMAMLWWLMRLQTPREGMRAQRVSSDLFILPLLCWGGLTLVLILGVEVADCYVTGRAFGAPYKAYHIVLLGPLVVVYFVGMLIIGRRMDRLRGKGRSRAAKQVAPVDRPRD